MSRSPDPQDLAPEALAEAQQEGHGYRAFGLSITSDLALPGLLDASISAEPDVVIRTARILPETVSAVNDSGDHVGTAPPGVLRALVEEGRTITVDPDLEADPDFVAAVITGELLAALLRQRGCLVLHGAAVARDGHAIGFLGNSGWGKSTLAASLVGRGWRLLTDDLLVVSGLSNGTSAGSSAGPAIVAGHPSMRLATEAAALVAADTHARHRAHAHTTKVRMDWDEAFLDAPVPVSHLFVLDPRGYEAPGVNPLPAHVAVLEMVHHTRVRLLLASPAYRQAHLAQCADLVGRTPVFSLRRQFGLEHVAALCDLVEATVAR